MIFFFNSKTKKTVAAILLFASVFIFTVTPAQKAKASLFTFDIPAELVGLGNMIANIANTGKEYGLDTAAWAIVKQAIKQVRNGVIDWIRTGQFGKPLIETSFLLGSSFKADQVARFFLTNLTGLDWCSHFPSFGQRMKMSINVNLSAQLTCTFNEDWKTFLSGGTCLACGNITSEATRYACFASCKGPSVKGLLLSTANNNDFWNNSVTVLGKKLELESEASKARQNEVKAGNGFLCKRDTAKNRCQTPGDFVSGHAKNAIKSQFGDFEAADELAEAIGAIVDALVAKAFDAGKNLY